MWDRISVVHVYSRSVANNILEPFMDAVGYKSRKEVLFKNLSDDVFRIIFYWLKLIFFYGKKTVHLQVRMSVVFIVAPATFQDFEQFIYVIG